MILQFNDLQFSWHFDFLVSYTDAEVVFKNYIYSVLTRTVKGDCTNKFTLVTTNKKVLDCAKGLKLNIINAIISIIYVEDEDDVIEYVIDTAVKTENKIAIFQEVNNK